MPPPTVEGSHGVTEGATEGAVVVDVVARARGQWLELVLGVLNTYHVEMPWAAAAQTLARQLDAPVAGDFGWEADGRGRVRAYPMPDWFDLTAVAERAPLLHPLARHYAATGSTQVLTTSMVPGLEPIVGRQYDAEMREAGIDQHLWIPVTFDPDGPRVIGTCRPREAYTRDQVRLADLAQRVLVTMHRHVVVLGGEHAVHWEDAAREVRLTPRQVAVLGLAADGWTSTAIGRRLRVSPRTVERHLENAYVRLHAHDRVTAVRRAEAAGVLPPRRPRDDAVWRRVASRRPAPAASARRVDDGVVEEGPAGVEAPHHPGAER